QEELAMGAIASGGVRVLNDEVVRIVGVGAETIEAGTERGLQGLRGRGGGDRGGRAPPGGRGKAGRPARRRPGARRGAGGGGGGGGWWGWGSGRRKRAPSCAPRPTTSFVPVHRSRSTPSVCGTRTSDRPPTRRCASCSPAPTPPRPPTLRGVRVGATACDGRARLLPTAPGTRNAAHTP